MKGAIIPENYQEWQHCITVDCGLELSQTFIEQRISALEDRSQHHTQQFIRRYGEQHYLRVLGWFKKADQRS